MKTGLLFLFSLITPLNICCVELQEQDLGQSSYNQHYNQAIEHIRMSFFAEGIAELKKAIDVAKAEALNKQYLKASIELGETMRKTLDFERGIEILLSLGEVHEYPLLEVRRLGRIAAIYHQISFPKQRQQYDSVIKYLNPAISIAQQNHFDLELASLKNELGYLVGNNFKQEDGLPHFFEAAALFHKNNDLQNYVGAMTKVLNYYVYSSPNEVKSDSIISVLSEIVDKTQWYTTKNQLYEIIAHHHLKRKKDSLTYSQWKIKALENILWYNDAIQVNQLNNLRVAYQTQKFQNQANASSLALEKQRKRMQELVIYISILGFLILLVGLFFYRERKVRRQINSINHKLTEANNKYQMLMIESNHRIKNNLQMIISMLEYTGMDMNPDNTRAFQRMSGKIYTISALHKHLYLDVHNEKVDLETYFKEIITLYSELSSGVFQIDVDFDQIKINSERIVYFGLILNELLSNSIEHSRTTLKTILIQVTKKVDCYQFDYQDGSHIPEESIEGTGSTLVKGLIERVSGKRFELDRAIGRYKFQFNA